MNAAGSSPSFVPLPQMLQASAAAWQDRKYQQSIEILEQALRMAPTQAGLLLQLGFCHGTLYNYAAAHECFQKAVNLTVRKREALMVAGTHCLTFHQNEMAGHYFEQALQLDGNFIDALVQIAKVRERQNRLDEAIDLIKRALKLNPGFPPAIVACARLYRSLKRLEDSETLLRSFLRTPHPDVRARAMAGYELGATLDVGQRYDEAMDAFLQAKAALQPSTVQNIAHLQEVRRARQQTAKNISADLFRRWQSGPLLPSQRPLAMLCGHPRSGTTLLEQVLDSHPAIVSLEETALFNEEALIPLANGKPIDSLSLLPLLDSLSPNQLQRSHADYFRCADLFLGQPVGDRVLIDKNPSLTPFIPAIIRIFPQAKFLVAIRDPRDVCISCFTQPLMPLSPTTTVFQGLEDTIADYNSIMGVWLAMKPVMPNPFLEVRYEDMVEDVESIARRTLEFLELPWNDRLLEFQKHGQNKLVRSPTYADVRKPVTKRAVGRWRNYQKYLEPYLPALEPFVKAFRYD